MILDRDRIVGVTDSSDDVDVQLSLYLSLLHKLSVVQVNIECRVLVGLK